MRCSNNTKILIIVALVLLGLYLYNNTNKPIKNEGSLSYNAVSNEENSDGSSETMNMTKEEEEDELMRRMQSKNSATGEYKSSNYTEGIRNSNSDNLNKFFEEGNLLNENQNNEISNNEIMYSNYSSNGQVKDEDKYNSANFLPQENNSDWFEDVNAISIKSRHLINIYKPIGINTVSSTLKNPSLDIRGSPPNPKTFVSPFLNSSIEPDHNIVGFS